jgi:hypothetical protein
VYLILGTAEGRRRREAEGERSSKPMDRERSTLARGPLEIECIFWGQLAALRRRALRAVLAQTSPLKPSW